MKPYIARNKYIERIKPFMRTDLIKVLVGQRRVGKSYLLYQLMDEIRKSEPKANIIYISPELYEFDSIRSYHELMRYIQAQRKSKQQLTYIFIDEIQDIADFEKALRSLQAEGQYDVYCTGSNAKLLSGELATLLSGRYIEQRVYSLTYLEFLEFHKLENTTAALDKYIRYGGLPYLSKLPLDDNNIYEYLRDIYNSIVLRDVVERYKIRNIRTLNDLTLFLSDNIGCMITANSISNFLKSQKIDVGVKQLLEYLSHLESTFLVHRVKRTDVIGKRIFEIGEKYYFEDLGIRHALVPFQNKDIGKVMENIVHHHLIANGYNAYVGKLRNKEVDFVVEKKGERAYIQVAYSVANASTHEREYGNLLAINDNYQKIVITMDELEGASYKGISTVPLRKFISTVL